MVRYDLKNKMTQNQTYFDSDEFYKNVSDLSQKANLPTKFILESLKGGKNNRIFCVIYDKNTKALLKTYFKHQNEMLDRLKREYTFINFAWNNNIRCLPKPFAADFQNNLALYKFIDGRKLNSSEINDKRIRQAISFFIKVNKYKDTAEAKDLPLASDACFSIEQHISHVKKRIEKLKKIETNSGINKKAKSFIYNELILKWGKAIAHLNESVRKYHLDVYETVQKDKCISPSDFGYHNAMLDKHNKLYFIDFEYAGWDDPTKMICDFFCQPEVPVPSKYFNFFVKTIVDKTSDPEKFKHGIKALLPAYKIKWCCILLNEFLDIESNRRNFAYGEVDFDKIKSEQLEKARKYLESIRF